MANIPVNIPSGEPNWKRAVLRWIAQTSEYFRSTQIVADNRTVFAQHTPSGILLSAQPESSGKTADTSSGGNQWNLEVEEKNGKYEVKVVYPEGGTSTVYWYSGMYNLGGILYYATQREPIVLTKQQMTKGQYIHLYRTLYSDGRTRQMNLGADSHQNDSFCAVAVGRVWLDKEGDIQTERYHTDTISLPQFMNGWGRGTSWKPNGIFLDFAYVPVSSTISKPDDDSSGGDDGGEAASIFSTMRVFVYMPGMYINGMFYQIWNYESWDYFEDVKLSVDIPTGCGSTAVLYLVYEPQTKKLYLKTEITYRLIPEEYRGLKSEEQQMRSYLRNYTLLAQFQLAPHNEYQYIYKVFQYKASDIPSLSFPELPPGVSIDAVNKKIQFQNIYTNVGVITYGEAKMDLKTTKGWHYIYAVWTYSRETPTDSKTWKLELQDGQENEFLTPAGNVTLKIPYCRYYYSVNTDDAENSGVAKVEILTRNPIFADRGYGPWLRAKLESSISGQGNKISSLESTSNNQATRISSLETRVTKLENKK